MQHNEEIKIYSISDRVKLLRRSNWNTPPIYVGGGYSVLNGCLDKAFLKGELEDTTRRIFRFLLRASPRNPQRPFQFSPELSHLMESRKFSSLLLADILLVAPVPAMS